MVHAGNKAKMISTATQNNCFSSPSENSQMRPNKPETVDHCDLKSPSSLHDSTISRLIDAVSLDNENDTCGSISALIGHPETTEQEEVYTILDEEVLSPTSVYNLKEQTIHLQAHSMESTPSNSLGSSPAKVPQGLGKQDTVGWDGFGEAEERIYEEVYDPIGPIPINSRPSNPSPLRQNSYPIPQSKPESFDNDRGFSKSFTQQRSYHGIGALNSCHQERLGDKQMEREAARCFQNGSASSESLPGLSDVPITVCRDRHLYSPNSDFDVMYSQVDYDCFTSSSASSASHYIKPYSQSQAQSYTKPQPQIQMFPHINSRNQPQPASGVPLQNSLGPFSDLPQSVPIASKTSSPCKSKSLGDLTSEDISCNFQSKYHIISRSFITSHMMNRKRMGALGDVTFQSQSSDPLTEQLRKLVSLEGDDGDGGSSQSPQLSQVTKPLSQPQPTNTAPSAPRDIDDSPPLLTRRLSSRSQSRVRHINSRARERQQEALRPRAGMVIDDAASIGGVVLRNKPASQNPPANRHSTGSYIAGYLGRLEDRGLPEGACTSLLYGYGDHYRDCHYTDHALQPADSSRSTSEPEVYFLLRL
ncbi:1-phosphatidylinositol 4,5-bisphosphate phosphodiesterase eta-1-like [Diretmus argenteus]